MAKIKIVLIVLLVAVIGGLVYHNQKQKPAEAAASISTAAKGSAAKVSQPAAPVTPNACAGNATGQVVIVSISKQHMWACDGTKISYDNPVVTGMQQYPSELTPVGSYKIYDKLTDQTLTGSDFTGHWSDYVYYWMPFLSNSYGVYGFHDLTDTANGAAGRAESDFGNIDINAPYTATKHGSHGCVELPLAAAKWLYGWSVVGTPVSIIS